MKKTVFPVFLVALVFALILSSCDEFFGSSWGSAREYDKSKVKVDAGNVGDYVDRAIGDSGLADAVSEAIIDELDKNASDSHLTQDEKNALSNAGIELAVESSGLGESILTHATGTLTELLEEGGEATEEKLKDIFGKVQADFKAANGAKAADNIAKIALHNVDKENSIPEFDPDYMASVSPGVLGEAVVVLVMGVIGDRSVDSLGDDWSNIEQIAEGLSFDPETAEVSIKEGGNPSDTAVILAACFNLITSDTGTKFADDPITSAIRDAFLKSK